MPGFTYQTINDEGDVIYEGKCLHIAQAKAEVSGLECSVLRNSMVIFTYSPNYKEWNVRSCSM